MEITPIPTPVRSDRRNWTIDQRRAYDRLRQDGKPVHAIVCELRGVPCYSDRLYAEAGQRHDKAMAAHLARYNTAMDRTNRRYRTEQINLSEYYIERDKATESYRTRREAELKKLTNARSLAMWLRGMERRGIQTTNDSVKAFRSSGFGTLANEIRKGTLQ